MPINLRASHEVLPRVWCCRQARGDGLVATLLGIMQPLLVIIMAAVVLLIVLAILLPIFELNNLIR